MSNGQRPARVVLVVLDGWGYRRGARGQRHRAGVDARLAPALGSLPAHPARGQRPGGGTSRRPDGQQRSRPPEPGRRPGGAAGPGPHLPEHPERRVLPARAAGRALRRLRQTRRHAAPGRPARAGRRARARPPPARLRRAGRAAPRCPPSPSTAFSTAATRRPTLGAEVVRTLLHGHAPHRRAARWTSPPLTGRYFGMDRDRRWERTKLAYDAMVHGAGTPVEHPVLAVQAAYQRGETDEFIQPLVPRAERRAGRHRCGTATGCSSSTIAATGCGRSCARSRVDGFDGFDRARPAGARACVTMTQYDQTFPLPAGVPAVQPGADPGRGAGRARAGPSSAPRRPRSIPTSPTSSTAATSRPTRARSAAWSRPSGWPPTTWRRR